MYIYIYIVLYIYIYTLYCIILYIYIHMLWSVEETLSRVVLSTSKCKYHVVSLLTCKGRCSGTACNLSRGETDDVKRQRFWTKENGRKQQQRNVRQVEARYVLENWGCQLGTWIYLDLDGFKRFQTIQLNGGKCYMTMCQNCGHQRTVSLTSMASLSMYIDLWSMP